MSIAYVIVLIAAGMSLFLFINKYVTISHVKKQNLKLSIKCYKIHTIFVSRIVFSFLKLFNND